MAKGYYPTKSPKPLKSGKLNPDSKEAARARHYRRKFGDVEIPPFSAICEICGKTGKVFLDHNHETRQLRGWLCITCNTGLGMFQDSRRLLSRAKKYLKKYGQVLED